MNFTPINIRKMMAIVALCVLVLTSTAIGSSLEKAKMLRRHGLFPEAKKELIEVIFSKQNPKDKAEAYYTLGSVAFQEKDISAALETWSQLVADFPESDQAKLVKDRINQLSEIVDEESRAVVDNAVAQSYLRHDDFWSKEVRRKKFIIDSSNISRIEVGISWYDKVIQEFPKTKASRIAYEEKMQTLIGRIYRLIEVMQAYIRADVPSKLYDDVNTSKQQLLTTFSAFEKNHPDATSLQAFRHQIAQIYGKTEKDLTLPDKWLNRIIEQAGENYTFYRDLAERRLQSPAAVLFHFR